MLLSIFFLKLFWGLPVKECEDQRCLNASPEIILSGTITGATESLNVRTDLTKQAAKIVRHSKTIFRDIVIGHTFTTLRASLASHQLKQKLIAAFDFVN